MSPVEFTAIAGFITAVVGALVTLYKIKPDRDALIITQAQGAATILNDLVETLREEVERERAACSRYKTRCAELELENEGLRRRYGERHGDDK